MNLRLQLLWKHASVALITTSEFSLFVIVSLDSQFALRLSVFLLKISDHTLVNISRVSSIFGARGDPTGNMSTGFGLTNMLLNGFLCQRRIASSQELMLCQSPIVDSSSV
jgi:hypothetical protein